MCLVGFSDRKTNSRNTNEAEMEHLLWLWVAVRVCILVNRCPMLSVINDEHYKTVKMDPSNGACGVKQLGSQPQTLVIVQ